MAATTLKKPAPRTRAGDPIELQRLLRMQPDPVAAAAELAAAYRALLAAREAKLAVRREVVGVNRRSRLALAAAVIRDCRDRIRQLESMIGRWSI
jgi:hypothetical protein